MHYLEQRCEISKRKPINRRVSGGRDVVYEEQAGVRNDMIRDQLKVAINNLDTFDGRTLNWYRGGHLKYGTDVDSTEKEF